MKKIIADLDNDWTLSEEEIECHRRNHLGALEMWIFPEAGGKKKLPKNGNDAASG